MIDFTFDYSTTRGRSLVGTVLVAALVVGSAAAQVGNSQGVLDPNTVSVDDLAQLTGMNANLARLVADGRPYLSQSALHDVLSDHLDDDALERLARELFVSINLNTASNAEILLVPGVGARMAHEFEEYRPYRSLAQFRREIGKYVDDDEVARLEQYVFVPLDLNRAEPDDFLTIPGVGKRLQHEFLEYRPYRSLEQFRREIGKYVDDDELARLERYVTLDANP